MKPEDLKKARGIQKMSSGPSTSGTSGGIKAKLDFRSSTGIPPKPTLNNSANPSLQSSHTARPVLDDKWKEFGDSMIFNVETFKKSIDDSIAANNFNKIARMFVAALKSFLAGEKLKIELRIVGVIAETIKIHGSKLNHVPLHRGLLFIISCSRSYPGNILELFISIITSLAKQQPVLDKCYLTAFLHDAVGMNVGLGTVNRCSWIEKPCSQELVERILTPFGTCIPLPEMYINSQVEGFSMGEFLIFFGNKFGAEATNRLENGTRSETSQKQMEVYLEFLKPWFDTIRGEVLPRPLFRALCLLCGSEHARFFIANRLEVWITLQKFHREISELLLIIGSNINAKNSELDRDVIDILLKLNTKNMKTRTVIGPFNVALKRICEHPANVEIVLNSLFINETGPPQNRSPTNLQTIYMILNSNPNETTRALARITAKELFKERENSIKMLRAFLRELIRGFYHSKTGEFPFSVFANQLFKEVKRRGVADEVPSLVVDLVAQIPLATISSLLVVRENVFHTKYNTPGPTGEFPFMTPEIRITRDKFQREFVAYCETVIEFLSTSRKLFYDEQLFIKCYSRLLFLEKNKEVYTNLEMAAVSESEISGCIRIFGECGVSEKMFLMLCREETNRLPQIAFMDLITALSQRAALFHPMSSLTPIIQFSDPFRLIDDFLKMTIYPKQSEIPRLHPILSDRVIYWKAWNCIVLWIAAGSEICPFFKEIYDGYPILRYLIHCILIKRFEFPQDFEGKSSVMMNEEESAIRAAEANVMKMYEKKMNKAVPPDAFVFPKKSSFRAPIFTEDFRLFAENLKLASRFAQCTSPPLLSRLISSVGAQKSLSAVREMLSTDSSTAKLLTSECVFHALMYYFDSQRIRETDHNSSVVVKALIRQAETSLKSIEPIEQDFLLQSFIASLASPNLAIRSAAVNTFSRLFPSSEDKAFDIVKLSGVPRFNSAKLKYMEIMAKAVLVESDTHLANSYIQFLTVNSMENEDDHRLARAVCQILSIDCLPIHSSLCEYFIQYVDMCTEVHKVNDVTSIDESLCCVDFGKYKIALSREVPVAIVQLLSKFDNQNTEKGMKNSPFETLVQFWLSPGLIPKLIDPKTGTSRDFLNLQMRKEMLKSGEQRVVDAALEGLSEKDAQEFVLVSQMSTETAEKVIKKAENMRIEGIDYQTISNMYLLIRGYRMRGVVSGESLVQRLKAELDRLDSIVSKEEPMEISEFNGNEKPSSFLFHSIQKEVESAFSNITMAKMQAADITNWLKTNCSANAKNKDQSSFRLPSAFIQSSMNDKDCALSCLTHIEVNLKFFLSHESAFQTLIVIIDSASNKFDFVRKRLETLAVKLLKSLKSAEIPSSVIGILRKHAANSSRTQQKSTKDIQIKVSTFAEFATLIKKTEKQEKRIVDEFMSCFVEDKGEVIETEDVLVFIKSIRIAYNGGNAETTVERCLSNRWSPQLRKIVCTSILEKHHPDICPIFVFRLMASYCRMFPIASYCEMFTIREKDNQFVLNMNSFRTSVIYFCDLAAKTEEYDLQIAKLIVDLEKQGSTEFGFYFCKALLQLSCSNPKALVRKTAKRLLELIEDRLPYIHYKPGVATSIRILTNVETRESCVRRCEQIVDRIVEIPIDPSMALSEDICEEERQTKEKEPKTDESEPQTSKYGKRGLDHRRGGPPPKKGRFISARDLPIPLGAAGSGQQANDDDNSSEEPVKQEWIATSHAMTRFISLLREHPNIVKMKLPVLANFISRVNSMNRRELKDEKRISKVELILQSVIALCRHLKPEEMSSIETALGNSFEFYEKHLEEGGFGIKELSSFSDTLIRACAEYLNNNFMEARTFLRDNRLIIDRVCKRCHDRYSAELVLDNSQPLSI
uniref:DUF3677 domain-containing protein n=1 Tax=Caenorhabditis tropicalis TaxID=1561998 RepID=A0A1I7UM22_9PELO